LTYINAPWPPEGVDFIKRGADAARYCIKQRGFVMLSALIGVLIICVVGAICFWVIEKFVNDSRLANLLKLLVVLVCLGAILQRLLPLAGINWF
jgi:uncharacterized membrane protein required for colicin V production